MYETLKAANAKRWAAMKLTKDYTSIAKRILAYKARYQTVSAKTNVPWPVIGVIHVREADQNFNTQLAQGDPLGRKSTHVPAGQGPYTGKDAWETAAQVALADSGGTSWKDWTPGGWTTFLEKYNGLGYANKGRSSPYVWAGTNQYSRGKYVADGQYSSTAIDTQPGCANLVATIAHLDPTVNTSNLAQSVSPSPHVTTGAVVAAGGAVAIAAQPHLWPWILGAVAAAIVAIIIVYTIEKNSK